MCCSFTKFAKFEINIDDNLRRYYCYWFLCKTKRIQMLHGFKDSFFIVIFFFIIIFCDFSAIVIYMLFHSLKKKKKKRQQIYYISEKN